MTGKFEITPAKSGKFMFNLKAGNGQVIGHSVMYSSVAAMENGVKSVQTNAPDAAVLT